jgi:hypothetical protein
VTENGDELDKSLNLRINEILDESMSEISQKDGSKSVGEFFLEIFIHKVKGEYGMEKWDD